jgi:hypothetical protein
MLSSSPWKILKVSPGAVILTSVVPTYGAEKSGKKHCPGK